MRNHYSSVKADVTVPAAATRYGLQTDPAGMAHCLFHPDRTPSMKLNEDYFYCFGCGKSGSVVDLTAKLFHTSPKEAVRILAADFHVDLQLPPPATGDLRRHDDNYVRCRRLLNEYMAMLHRWKRRYSPKDSAETFDPRYVEACILFEPIEYLASYLATAPREQRESVVKELMAEGRMDRLEAHLVENAER